MRRLQPQCRVKGTSELVANLSCVAQNCAGVSCTCVKSGCRRTVSEVTEGGCTARPAVTNMAVLKEVSEVADVTHRNLK